MYCFRLGARRHPRLPWRSEAKPVLLPLLLVALISSPSPFRSSSSRVPVNMSASSLKNALMRLLLGKRQYYDIDRHGGSM